MLQALVMEDMDPDVSLLQNFLEVSGWRNRGNGSPILSLIFGRKDKEYGDSLGVFSARRPSVLKPQRAITMTWRPLPLSFCL